MKSPLIDINPVTGHTFKISYLDKDGQPIIGDVKQITQDHFEVFIKEKGVKVHCMKDKDGVLACRLNRKREVSWVEGIGKAIAERVEADCQV
jgi:hypothetical protein